MISNIVILRLDFLLIINSLDILLYNSVDRADRELKLAWPSAILPNGLRDESIEFDRRRSRSAYQTQSSRPPSGFAALGRLAR